MAQYEVRTFDLATVRDKFPITSRAKFVSSIAVTALPAGADARLQFGDDKPVISAAVNRTFQLCPPENSGVYLTNPAGVGSLEVVISYADNGGPGLEVGNL